MPTMGESTLRQRTTAPSDNSIDLKQAKEENPTTLAAPSHERLLSRHKTIRPLNPTTIQFGTKNADGTITTTSTFVAKANPSLLDQVLGVLVKPFSFLFFLLLHLWNELAMSARTIKTMTQVFFLPHLFPTTPQLVRILRDDLGKDLAKKPKHLAVILPAGSEGEDAWEIKVTQLAQWAVASGIECLSVMRDEDPFEDTVELLQERLDDGMARFYKEESIVPKALVRTLSPIRNSLHYLNQPQEPASEQRKRLHHGETFDLDVVILSPKDGHDRLTSNVRELGEAALRKEIRSEDITVDSLDRQLSVDLSEPELLIILKDNLDLSSYPPWHIRLTEIFHHPDQAVVPLYTMFLQALHRYAKCEQRFGK